MTVKKITVDIGLKSNYSPIFKKSRPIPLGLRETVKTEIDRMESQNIIEKVQYSEWGTPIVIVKKPNGKIRLCCDYKVTLNTQIAEVATPNLNVEDLLSEVGKAKFFTKLDLEGAYLQLKLNERSKNPTTINTPWGLYRFNRLPFGIKSAPSIFQTAMQQITLDLPGVLVYLDDILVFGNTEKEHDERLEALNKKLVEFNVKLNMEKSLIKSRQVKFLGHVLTEKGIQPNKDLIASIVNAPYPGNKTQLQSFIGSVQYYSKFIPNLADKLKVLTDLLQHQTKWKFTEVEENAIDTLKSTLTGELVLRPFSLSTLCQLQCDASPFGLGAVLQQNQHPVIYISRKLTPTEQNYSQTEREALSIVWAVKRLHKFLFGHHFEIITDHRALKFIFHPFNATSNVQAAKLQRWSITLSAYDYSIINKPASELIVADFLSRNFKNNGNYKHVNFLFKTNKETSFLLNCKLFKSIMNSEPYIMLKNHIMNGQAELLNEEFRKMKPIYHQLSVKEDFIFVGSKLFIPPEMVPYILNHLHESHLGILATKKLARRYYFWFNMTKTIEEKVKSCRYCNEFKPKSSNKNELSPWPQSKFPWERVHVDFFQINQTYFFILVDSYTKFPEVYVTNDMTTRTVITILQSSFSCFGIPKCLVSDNGPAFKAEEFQAWLNSIGCRQLTIAPYHPQSNGIAERFVRTMKEQLKNCPTSKFRDTINKFLFCYRNLEHNSTGFAPAELMFNRKIRTSHTAFCEPKEAWIHDPLKKTFEEAEIIGDLGKVVKVVRKPNGVITKRHIDQIKMNPHNESPIHQNQTTNLQIPIHTDPPPRRGVRIRKPANIFSPT